MSPLTFQQNKLSEESKLEAKKQLYQLVSSFREALSSENIFPTLASFFKAQEHFLHFPFENIAEKIFVENDGSSEREDEVGRKNMIISLWKQRALSWLGW